MENQAVDLTLGNLVITSTIPIYSFSDSSILSRDTRNNFSSETYFYRHNIILVVNCSKHRCWITTTIFLNFNLNVKFQKLANKWRLLPWLGNHGNPVLALMPKEKEEGSRHPGKRMGRVDDNEICLTANEYKELLK